MSKLRKSFRRRGVLGTAGHAIQRVTHPLLELTPGRRRQRREKEEADRAFDTQHGVETGGIIQLNQLRIAGSTWEFGVPYWAIDPGVFNRLVGALAIQHEQFTFIDYGSGKGRAVLLASEYPFRKIVGVEFSPELVEVAVRNVRNYRSDGQRCRDIELLCTDALDYDLPPGPVVCYFYNPFESQVMEGVAAKIRESYRSDPREMYILYANPKHDEVWQRVGGFQKVAATSDYTVYKAAD